MTPSSTVTFFKYSYSLQIDIFSLKFSPDGPPSLGEVDNSGQLTLDGLKTSNSKRIECTAIGGSVGEEKIECIYANHDGSAADQILDLLNPGKEDVFQTFSDVKGMNAEGGGDILLRGLQSKVNLTAFQVADLTLDYSRVGINVIAENTIIIQAKEINAGEFVMIFDGMTGSGNLLLPEPEQAFLTTTFTGQCNNSWALTGHSSIVVAGDKIGSVCSIKSSGGSATVAKLTIDFGFENHNDCLDGNEVIIDTECRITNCTGIDAGENSWVRATIKRPDLDNDIVVLVGSSFIDIDIKMSACRDKVHIKRTQATDGFIDIQMGGDNDEIYIGQPSDGLDSIYKSILVNGGSGNDMLVVNDTSSIKDKNATTAPGSVLGVLSAVTAGEPEDIDYQATEVVDIHLNEWTSIIQLGFEDIFGFSPDQAVEWVSILSTAYSP